MSCAVVRWPGFWNSVNSASSKRTMITQRAKLRRLAFIPCPSAAVGRQPLRPLHCPQVKANSRPSRSQFRCRAAPCQGNLTRISSHSTAVWRRRACHIRPWLRLSATRRRSAAPGRARPRAGRGQRHQRSRQGAAQPRRARALGAPALRAPRSSASSLPSWTGPSSPTCAIARPSRRSATSAGQAGEFFGIEHDRAAIGPRPLRQSLRPRRRPPSRSPPRRAAAAAPAARGGARRAPRARAPASARAAARG